MTHDPLCRPPWNYGGGGHCEGCDLIAAVRADERDKAEQRVRGADGTCFMDYCTEAAAAAARGEA